MGAVMSTSSAIQGSLVLFDLDLGSLVLSDLDLPAVARWAACRQRRRASGNFMMMVSSA